MTLGEIGLRRSHWYTTGLIAILILTVAGLRFWARDPEGVGALLQTLAALVAVGIGIAVYIGLLHRSKIKNYRAFAPELAGAVLTLSLLFVAGMILDAIVAGIFFLYTLLVGQIGFLQRVVSLTRQKHPSSGLIGLSAFVCGSFSLLLVIASILTMQQLPTGDTPIPFVFSMVLWPSAMFAWLFILGDNARSGMELVLYGSPVGIPVTIIACSMLGAFMGKLGSMVEGLLPDLRRHKLRF